MYRYRVAQFFDAFAASCKAILKALAEIGEKLMALYERGKRAASCKAILKALAEIGEKLMALYERGKRKAADLAECRCQVQNDTGEAIPAGTRIEMAWGREGWKLLRILPDGEHQPFGHLPHWVSGGVVGIVRSTQGVRVRDDWTGRHFDALQRVGQTIGLGSRVRIALDPKSGRYAVETVYSGPDAPEPKPVNLILDDSAASGDYSYHARQAEFNAAVLDPTNRPCNDGPFCRGTFVSESDARRAIGLAGPEAPESKPARGFLGQLWETCPATDEHGTEPRATVISLATLAFREARNGLGVELPEGTRVRVVPDPNPPGFRIESVESHPGQAHPDLTPPVQYQARVIEPEAPALPAPPDVLALPGPSKGSVIIGDFGGENMLPHRGPKSEH